MFRCIGRGDVFPFEQGILISDSSLIDHGGDRTDATVLELAAQGHNLTRMASQNSFASFEEMTDHIVGGAEHIGGGGVEGFLTALRSFADGQMGSRPHHLTPTTWHGMQMVVHNRLLLSAA